MFFCPPSHSGTLLTLTITENTLTLPFYSFSRGSHSKQSTNSAFRKIKSQKCMVLRWLKSRSHVENKPHLRNQVLPTQNTHALGFNYSLLTAVKMFHQFQSISFCSDDTWAWTLDGSSPLHGLQSAWAPVCTGSSLPSCVLFSTCEGKQKCNLLAVVALISY